MSDYKQPEFYRFNEDSIKLVKYVASKIKETNTILDLGAGSGVIGIELANILKAKHLTLLEIQSEWKPYLEHNIENFLNKDTKSEIMESSFKSWMPERKYDLIVCNPPYYLPEHGQPSSDRRKEIARSFVIDGWEYLITAIEKALSANGSAYLVVKNDPRILKEIVSSVLKIEFEKMNDLVFVRITSTEYKSKSKSS